MIISSVREGANRPDEVVSMRHKNSYRKFSRTHEHRRAMFRNLATSLLRHERCETTIGKAKDLRRVVEKLISLAGRDQSLAARRQAFGYLMGKDVVHKLFSDIGPRFADRKGGYTRVLRTRRRVGDAAEMALIELVTEPLKTSAKKPSSAKKTPAVKKSKPATSEAAAS